MTVKIETDGEYVTVEQSAYFDEPTKLKPSEARDLAEKLELLADSVE